MVKLYDANDLTDSGGNGAVIIVSDCTSENQFFQELAQAMENGTMTERWGGDLTHKFAYIVENATDIACKMRGYKNNVSVRTVMMAGSMWPRESDKPVCSYDSVHPMAAALAQSEADREEEIA